jgi:hypothetical protein
VDRAVRVTAPVPEDVIAGDQEYLIRVVAVHARRLQVRGLITQGPEAVTYVTSVIQSLLPLLPYLLAASK